MSIKYEPSKLLRKIAPGSKIEKSLKSNLTLKRAAFAHLEAFDFLDVEALTRVAMKTLKGYRARVKADPELEAADLVDDPAQLIQRVENEIVLQVAEEIKDQYAGESYTWLPSDAEEPDPEHQLNYGKTFVIGDGEMPGDRIGCKCGMEIHVKGSSLEL